MKTMIALGLLLMVVLAFGAAVLSTSTTTTEKPILGATGVAKLDGPDDPTPCTPDDPSCRPR